MKRYVFLIFLCIPLVMFAQSRELLKMSKRINGVWHQIDTIQNSIHEEIWVFKQEYKNSGSGELQYLINDTIRDNPKPFVWIMHELPNENSRFLQIRFYKDKIEYPLLEIERIDKKHIIFTDWGNWERKTNK